MKHKNIVQVVAIATTLLIALPLAGQTGTRDTTPQQPSSRQYGNDQNRDQNRQQQMKNQDKMSTVGKSPVSASDLLGLDLVGMSGDKIGEIDELYIDIESGKILGAVVSAGGIAGIGDDQYVVSLSELQYNEEEDHVRINRTEQSLRNSPKYREGDMSVFESVNREWHKRKDHSSSSMREKDSDNTPVGSRDSTTSRM